MPQAIPAAIAAVSAAYQAVIGYVAAPLVTALGEGAAIAVATAAVNTAITATVSMGLNALAQSQLPSPEAGKITRKQPRPPRAYMVGEASRITGAFKLRESRNNRLAVVLAIAEERSAGAPSRYWLNDDEVTVISGWVQQGEGERYGSGDLVRLETRVGLPTETAYSYLFTHFGDLWTSDHRGDGFSSLMMVARHGSREGFASLYPNGEPMPSIADQKVCYDWRDETQELDAPSTWKASANPVVWLVFVEWYRHGRSWARCIAPALDALTVEADYCDELVAKIGGTEPRYRCAGNYLSTVEPQAVREALLSTFDGWLSVNGKGHMVVKAGRYEEPTFTITGEHIEAYSWRAFQTDEEACNELIVSYVSPVHAFTEVECDPWRDEDDIDARGIVRPENLNLPWVSYHTQARRLAKRKMARLAAQRRGTITTGIYGLNGLGERYIRVQNPELTSMADVVLEVMNVEVNLAAASVTFDVILADENIDAWNPASEEGVQPIVGTRPTQERPAAPVITDVEVFSDLVGTVEGARLRIILDTPERSDLSYTTGWRRAGSVSWVEDAAVIAGISGGFPVLETGFVPAVDDLEVRVNGITGGGRPSDWSDTYGPIDATTTTPPYVVPPLTSLVPTGGAGKISVSVREPSALPAYERFQYNTSNTTVGATALPDEAPTAVSYLKSFEITGLAAGSYYVFATAFDEDDTPSTTISAGPVTVT